MAAANENGNGQSFEDLLDNEGTTAGALVLTAFMTTATQPLTCVRLLMQVIVGVLCVKLLGFTSFASVLSPHSNIHYKLKLIISLIKKAVRIGLYHENYPFTFILSMIRWFLNRLLYHYNLAEPN